MAFQKGFGGQRPQGDGFQRQMFQGDWVCAECGAKITELPFQPSADRPIYCRDCHKKYRDKRGQ